KQREAANHEAPPYLDFSGRMEEKAKVLGAPAFTAASFTRLTISFSPKMKRHEFSPRCPNRVLPLEPEGSGLTPNRARRVGCRAAARQRSQDKRDDFLMVRDIHLGTHQ